MEKKMNRVQRWLDRCVTACKSGAWGSALIEVECLEAELKSAREEIWAMAIANPRPQISVFRSVFRHLLRVSTVALALLLALVLPLSLDSEKRYGPVRALSGEGTFTWVTLDEGQILDALRRDLSENNRGRAAEVPLILTQARPRAKASSNVKLPLPAAIEEKAGGKVNSDERDRKEEHVPVEKVLSLIQVGQRAIQMGEPAVRVVP